MSLPTTPDSASPWTDDLLNQARQTGDLEADALAKLVLTTALAPSAGGQFDYNHLVDLADLLTTDAEMLLLKDSHLSTCIAEYPDDLQAHYRPMPAPPWVDQKKLKLAGRLWKDNSLAMLGVLYAASLPACYLIANGIPALYRTDKLRDQKYLFQRIYETGMMLDAVMDPGGIRVVNDSPHHPTTPQPMLDALRELDPAGAWELREGKVVRTNAAAPFPPGFDSNVVEARLRRKQGQAGWRNFLWGRGYIAAKKVRLLHASMRFMLLNPGALTAHVKTATAGAPIPDRLVQNYQARTWDTAARGVPVNQEDLAYTLLTFSYLIPKGLERWGCELSLEQKEAFLHLWRVVGHIMGLQENLMPDNWPQAGEFFDRVLRRQGRGSPEGVALTEAVAGFLKTYLPPLFGLREYLPYTLITDLMGERAEELMSPENWARVNDTFGVILTGGVRLVLMAYYRMYSVARQFKLVEGAFGNLFHRTSEELVGSWRDEYLRRPFYVPTDLTTWQVVSGVDDAFREQLQAWRNRVFLGVFLAVAWLGVAMALMATAGALALLQPVLHHWMTVMVVAGLGVLTALYAAWRMEVSLPRIFKKRPKPEAISIRRPS